MQERNGWCRDLDRSEYTFPVFEYCHPDYYSDTDDEVEFVGGVDVCGERLITGHSVIGKSWLRREVVRNGRGGISGCANRVTFMRHERASF